MAKKSSSSDKMADSCKKIGKENLQVSDVLRAVSDRDNKSRLTLGPLLFHWDPHKKRDFYFHVADEVDVDTVFLGEVVCSKRIPFFVPYQQKVIERLLRAGKEVVLSTLALMTTPREIESLREAIDTGLPIEANDVAALSLLRGKNFIVGPTINVFNEGARDFMVAEGAQRIVVPVEAPLRSIKILAQGTEAKTPQIEVQVFGKQSLSVSMRCYHARAFGRDKDHCQIACGVSPDGLVIDTMDHKPILTVNGTQVLSQGYGVALAEIKDMQAHGVTHFRLSPHDVQMSKIATLYRQVIQGHESGDSALSLLREILPNTPFINGFLHAGEGMGWR